MPGDISVTEKSRLSLRLTLKLAREARRITQPELAAALETTVKRLRALERGTTGLTRERLHQVAAPLAPPAGALDLQVFLAGALEEAPAGGDGEPGVSPLDPSPAELWELRRGLMSGAWRQVMAAEEKQRRELRRARIEQALEEAEALWRRLEAHPAAERPALVMGVEAFWHWGLCHQLCALSERKASHSAKDSLALAQLARLVAERLEGPPAWRSRWLGSAGLVVGNALRVKGELDPADRELARALRHWEEGVAASDPELFDEGRALDLLASLRRAQRRFAEALELHDRALAVSGTTGRGVILLNMAVTLEQQGQIGLALKTLQTAVPRIDAAQQPRQWFGLRFNLAVNLCHLGEYRAAEPLVAEVRQLAIDLGDEIHLVRTLWLQARMLAGLGRRPEARAGLEQVRRDFATRGMAYDFALASLNLAVLYLEDGETQPVAALAVQMEPIFRSRKIHREALMALGVFCQAARQEALTLDLAQRIMVFLEKARQDPTLHFEP
jgi:tetratricopeptide (TPR) repeat protein